MQRPSSEASKPEQRIYPGVSTATRRIRWKSENGPCDGDSSDRQLLFVAEEPADLGMPYVAAADDEGREGTFHAVEDTCEAGPDGEVEVG